MVSYLSAASWSRLVTVGADGEAFYLQVEKAVVNSEDLPPFLPHFPF
jgi:hypothetical protein